MSHERGYVNVAAAETKEEYDGSTAAGFTDHEHLFHCLARFVQPESEIDEKSSSTSFSSHGSSKQSAVSAAAAAFAKNSNRQSSHPSITRVKEINEYHVITVHELLCTIRPLSFSK